MTREITDPAELRRWLRTALPGELTQWLLDSPDRIQRFSPVAALFSTTITGIDETARSVECELRIGPAARNPWGHVHGGLISAAIDEIAGVCAVLFAGPRSFSGTISNTVDYLAPLREGCFTLRATLLKSSLTLAAVRAELSCGGELTTAGLVLFSLRRDLKAQSGADGN